MSGPAVQGGRNSSAVDMVVMWRQGSVDLHYHAKVERVDFLDMFAQEILRQAPPISATSFMIHIQCGQLQCLPEKIRLKKLPPLYLSSFGPHFEPTNGIPLSPGSRFRYTLSRIGVLVRGS